MLDSTLLLSDTNLSGLREPCWIGIDPGQARCGVAASDPSHTLASPLGAVPTQPRPELGQRVAALLGQRELAGLVIGLPLDQRGGEGESAQLARDLGAQLEAHFGVTAHYVDERFTTAATAVRRREAGRSAKQQRGEIDAWTAAAILQDWLDRIRQG